MRRALLAVHSVLFWIERRSEWARWLLLGPARVDGSTLTHLGTVAGWRVGWQDAHRWWGTLDYFEGLMSENGGPQMRQCILRVGPLWICRDIAA